MQMQEVKEHSQSYKWRTDQERTGTRKGGKLKHSRSQIPVPWHGPVVPQGVPQLSFLFIQAAPHQSHGLQGQHGTAHLRSKLWAPRRIYNLERDRRIRTKNTHAHTCMVNAPPTLTANLNSENSHMTQAFLDWTAGCACVRERVGGVMPKADGKDC